MQATNLTEGQLVGPKPVHLGCLVSIRSRVTPNHDGIEDCHDVSRVVAIRIRHSVLWPPENTEYVAELDCDAGLLLGLPDGTVTRTLAGFNCAANGGPIARVNQADEKNTSGVVSWQD